MQSIAETCVRFDAAHLSINLVSEIAVPMFTTLIGVFIVTCMCYLALFLRCVILYLVVRSLYKYAAVVPLNC